MGVLCLVGTESVNCAEPSQCPGTRIHTRDRPENTEYYPKRPIEGNKVPISIDSGVVGIGKDSYK